jgi:hypothetical protein
MFSVAGASTSGDIHTVTDRTATITLGGASGFSGFLISVENGKGSFNNYDSLTTKGPIATCGSNPSVGHNNKKTKNSVSTTYTMDTSETEVVVKVTVVKDYSNYFMWTKRLKYEAASTPAPTAPSTPAPTTLECSNNKKDGSETDTDCGGSTCPKCAATKACSTGTDCDSETCKVSVGLLD